MKRIILLVIAAVVLAAGIYYWASRGAAGKEAVADVTTAKVQRGAIRLAVSSTGKIVSNLDVEIKCKASGEIVKLPFDVSDRVKKGELLIELDPVDEQRVVDQEQVSLSSSEAKLVIARQNQTIAERTLGTDRQKAEAALMAAHARATARITAAVM